ncbi:hypothetical protein LCGC14_0764470 [marine sediment metagenome]|uniref:Acetylxylan esterase n=2 Tax=root TaxID=1 RepID=A0A831VV71_9FLAO|nr:acetylxylan esterase [Pricia antarctica]
MRKGLRICLVFFILFVKAQAQDYDKSEGPVINYEESKVPDYNLPKVLETLDGDIIRNKASWEKKRRPEILKLFEDNVYGQLPEAYDGINFKVKKKVPDAMYGKATLKEVEISVWKESDSVNIRLTLFIPNNVERPIPVFLLINNRGEYNTDPTRFIRSQFWPAEMIIDNGYAVAAFHVSDAAPDNIENYQDGVLQLYPEQLGANNGMKAIGSWAWAASRVMDYFEQNKEIDSEKASLVGHSRGGKASLWAGAQDQRFALIFSNCSGNTGAALSRRMFGETVKRINISFPHWFADSYAKYNDNENALPVDQHMLISLIAPRPVYITSASEDLWADPKGSYLSLLHAEKVYDLYGGNSALPRNPPELDSPIIASNLGYHNREGIHNLTAYDWKNFIKFANYHFDR